MSLFPACVHHQWPTHDSQVISHPGSLIPTGTDVTDKGTIIISPVHTTPSLTLKTPELPCCFSAVSFSAWNALPFPSACSATSHPLKPSSSQHLPHLQNSLRPPLSCLFYTYFYQELHLTYCLSLYTFCPLPEDDFLLFLSVSPTWGKLNSFSSLRPSVC